MESESDYLERKFASVDSGSDSQKGKRDSLKSDIDSVEWKKYYSEWKGADLE